MILIVPGSSHPSLYKEIDDFNSSTTPHYVRKSMILIVPGSSHASLYKEIHYFNCPWLPPLLII